LKAALKASFNATPWQRCPFQLQKNAQEHVTKQHLKGRVATDIKVIFNADDRAHAEERLKDFVKTYAESQPKLAAWAEDNLSRKAPPSSHCPKPAGSVCGPPTPEKTSTPGQEIH
jgi:transposase-like protein